MPEFLCFVCLSQSLLREPKDPCGFGKRECALVGLGISSVGLELLLTHTCLLAKPPEGSHTLTSEVGDHRLIIGSERDKLEHQHLG